MSDVTLESGHISSLAVVMLAAELVESAGTPTAEKLCDIARRLVNLATDNGRLSRPFLHILPMEMPGLTWEMLDALWKHDTPLSGGGAGS